MFLRDASGNIHPPMSDHAGVYFPCRQHSHLVCMDTHAARPSRTNRFTRGKELRHMKPSRLIFASWRYNSVFDASCCDAQQISDYNNFPFIHRQTYSSTCVIAVPNNPHRCRRAFSKMPCLYMACCLNFSYCSVWRKRAIHSLWHKRYTDVAYSACNNSV